MASSLSRAKTELIETIAEREGFADYTIDVQSGSMKGDGYMGIMHTVCVEEKTTMKQLNLIVKSAHKSDELRKQAPIRKAYEREIFMYTTLFDRFKSLQDDYNVANPFCETVKCYGTLFDDGEECLVFENLRTKGYDLWDRKKPMDVAHISQVLATYGKLHAVSFALKRLQPEMFDTLKGDMQNIFDEGAMKEQLDDMAKAMMKNLFDAVDGNVQATRALEKLSGEIKDFFDVQMKTTNQFSVILHGDCWCNNMMFNYQDDGRPKVCLLDWQISYVGSPVLDLSYFFYTCSPKEVINDVVRFLTIYHNSLSATLSSFGLDADDLFPFDALENEWRTYCKYGLLMASVVLKLMISEVSEVPDMSAIAESGGKIMEQLCESTSVNIAVFNKRICDVVTSMIDKGYL